jgi:hypothetical protein
MSRFGGKLSRFEPSPQAPPKNVVIKKQSAFQAGGERHAHRFTERALWLPRRAAVPCSNRSMFGVLLFVNDFR